MNHYLVRTEIPAAHLRDVRERRRRGERIASLLRSSGIEARWVECRTSWLWADVRDVIEASDERVAQAAADLIALAEVNDAAA